MAKTKQADAFSPLRGQFKEMKKENKQLKDKNKESEKKIKECEKKNKESEKKIKEMEKRNKEFVKELEKENKELQKRLKTSDNQKTAESKDIKDELSEYAKLAIKVSRDPLTSEELENFLMNDVFGKCNKNIPVITSIRKYSNDIDDVKKQLVCLHNNVKDYMDYRERQKKLDDKLIKTIRKLHETIGKEQEKLMYNGKSPLNRNSEDINNGRLTRKRKSMGDDGSCSSQDSQDGPVMDVTFNFNKRVKINSSSEDSRESSPISEFTESDELNSQRTINQREFRD